jgi:hypothetical protein
LGVSTRISASAETDGGAPERAKAISAAALGIKYFAIGAIEVAGSACDAWPYATAHDASNEARARDATFFMGPPKSSLDYYGLECDVKRAAESTAPTRKSYQLTLAPRRALSNNSEDNPLGHLRINFALE